MYSGEGFERLLRSMLLLTNNINCSEWSNSRNIARIVVVDVCAYDKGARDGAWRRVSSSAQVMFYLKLFQIEFLLFSVIS